MPFRPRPLSSVLLPLCLLALVPAAGAAPVLTWLPAGVPGGAPDPAQASLYYDGDGGRLVGTEAEVATALAARGGVRIDAPPASDLYVYVLEDGARAEFAPPAAVLVRAAHEVLLAVPRGDAGDVLPRLAAASDDALSGFRQLVHVPLTPIAWPAAAPARIAARTPFDPDIAGAIALVTSATYLDAWQPLEDFSPRTTFAVPENENAVNWIHDRFAAMGYGSAPGMDLAFHSYSQSGMIRRNVVATLHGDVPEVVYVTGHFDATSGTDEICAPGADDNASGTVAVLEAARVMAQLPGGFHRTLKFATFNGEEQGLRGSSAYVNMIAGQGEVVAGVYNADMIAYRGVDPAPADSWMFINAASSFLADILVDAVDLYLPGQLGPIVGGALVTASDHASFWNRGYPAILVIESKLFGGELSPWYHTCDDVIANYVDEIDFAVRNTRAIIAAAAIVARDYQPGTSAPAVDAAGAARLLAPFPSPMRDGAELSFVLPSAQPVRLEMVDVRGRRVRTLVRSPRGEGAHAVRWDGRDDAGVPVGAGIYFARLVLPESGAELARKVTVVR